MRHLPILRYFLILSAVLCVSCGTALPTVKPFKLEVQQGNVVTSKMLLQLRPGMTKSQVRFIMGTPLIQDSFHGNRWDYVYQLRENGKITEQRRVILDFENELLKTVRGDVAPSSSKLETPQDAAANKGSREGSRIVQPNKKAEDKTLLDKLKFWKKDDTPAKVRSKDAVDKTKDLEMNPSLSKDAPVATATPVESAPVDTPVEETKSILSVPLEPGMDSPPVISTPVERANKPVVQPKAPPVVKSPDVEKIPSPPPAKIQKPKENINSDKKPVQEHAETMQFDKELNTPPEAVQSEAQPAMPASRAGNKNIPPPKELPPEGSPDFFDRMLEKIGF